MKPETAARILVGETSKQLCGETPNRLREGARRVGFFFATERQISSAAGREAAVSLLCVEPSKQLCGETSDRLREEAKWVGSFSSTQRQISLVTKRQTNFANGQGTTSLLLCDETPRELCCETSDQPCNESSSRRARRRVGVHHITRQ